MKSRLLLQITFFIGCALETLADAHQQEVQKNASTFAQPANRDLIQAAFWDKGIALTKEELDEFDSKFQLNDLKLFLKWGIRSPQFLLKNCVNPIRINRGPDHSVVRYPIYAVYTLLKRGVSPQFFEQPPEETLKVLEMLILPEEPLEAFLKCINEYDNSQEFYAAWSLKADKEMIRKWSNLPEIQSSFSYNITALNSINKSVPTLFDAGMEETIQIATDGIKNKEWDFNALLHFCAFRRWKMAGWQNQGRAYLFGMLRERVKSTIKTNCSGPYEPLQYGLIRLHEEQLKTNPTLKIPDPMPEFFYAKSSFSSDATGSFFINIRGKAIELSGINLSNDPVSIIHTQGANIDILMEETSRLYVQAMQASDLATFHSLSGKMFWILCQAKPWDRGDPAIAEMMIRAMALSKGFESLPWKSDVIPWVEVSICIDGNEFGNNFHFLFGP